MKFRGTRQQIAIIRKQQKTQILINRVLAMRMETSQTTLTENRRSIALSAQKGHSAMNCPKKKPNETIPKP